MSKLGIIGGTGLSSINAIAKPIEQLGVETPFGKPSAPLTMAESNNGHALAFLPRHGDDSSVPPHQINYRANIWALKESGVDRIIAISAVGGIGSEATPASIVIPDQVIDYTWGREHTFSDGVSSELQHIEFTTPYSSELRSEVLKAAARSGIEYVNGGVHGVTQGPRLETAAEINRMERDGCTLVGMTGMPEAALARELGMNYVCCAVVVNWAAGLSDEVITMDVIRAYVEQGQKKLIRLFEAYLSA